MAQQTSRQVISTSQPRSITVGGVKKIGVTQEVVYTSGAGYKKKNGKEALVSKTVHELMN
jgi:hypothetical protein